MSRKPLVPLSREERRKRLEAMGLDENMFPLSATRLEHAANQKIQEADQMTETPKFPAWLTTTAKILAPIAGAALLALPAIALPAWVTFAVFALATVAALIAGIGTPSPFNGRPVLSGSAAALAGGVATALFPISEALPEGFAKNAVLAAAVLLAGAAGIALPRKA